MSCAHRWERSKETGQKGKPVSHITIQKEIGTLASLWNKWALPQRLVAGPAKTQPPQAQNKRYWAELSREWDGAEVRGQDSVFQHLETEIDTRRQPRQWLIHLCDGQSVARERKSGLI